MKQPFWLVNSTLLFFLLMAGVLVLLLRPKKPIRVSFEPSSETRLSSQEVAKIDISKIYMNDLFDTYKQPVINKPPAPQKTQMPTPPAPQPPPVPPVSQVKFLEPLQITLRGIIVGSDETMTTAILEDAKTSKAQNYRVGDTISDAQIIRILRNKVILVRSNGQQETLYVNQYDAEIEQLLVPSDWSTTIKKTGNTSYAIDPEEFVKRVRSLSVLIDDLNLTTVYKQGTSLGCRVGKVDKTLAAALGLAQGDIITKVQDAPITTVQERLAVYKTVTSTSLGDTIRVTIIRKNQQINLTYTLEKFETLSTQSSSVNTTPTSWEAEKEKMNILEQKYKFAPTRQQLQKRDQESMRSLSSQRGYRPRRSIIDTMDN